MKILLLLLSFHALAAETCIKDPKQDYLKQFSLSKVENWRLVEIDLKKDQLMDLNISTDEQCGAKGCEGALYWQKTKGCYKQVMLYEGSIKILPPTGPGLAEIQSGKKIYKYSLLGEKYE